MTPPHTLRFCPACNATVVAGHNFCGVCGYNLTQQLPRHLRDPLIGAVVGGRYRLMSKIGTGGMGSVYKVEHVRMGKIMAMKILHGDLSRDEGMIRRFNREARAVSKLVSHNTVQVFDYGRSDGLVYLVMEFLRGRDFGVLLKDIGPLPPERCADVIAQICNSLSEAHEVGVVHRDLKPENVFLCAPRSGSELVKVLDFGLAKIIERGETQPRQTLQGSIIGTPYYMSPEQIRGDDVSHSGDIYSMGAVIYHLLTGKPPFVASSPLGILASHLNDPVPSLSEHAPTPELVAQFERIEPVVNLAMAKYPGERYKSVRELSDALSEAVSTKPKQEEVVQEQPAEPEVPKVPAQEWSEQVIPSPETWSSELDEISTRADWEHYELGLKFRRVASSFLFVAVLVGVGFGVYWGVIQENFFKRAVEQEPNDRTIDATRLYTEPLQATIGLPASGSRADVDFFEIRHDGAPGQSINVDISGVDGLDLVVELYDINGRRLMRSNTAKAGGGESLRGALWQGEPLFVSVREVWIEGIPARHATTSPYTVGYEAGVAEVGLEQEPNDGTHQAKSLDPGVERFGTISHPEDIDLYVLPPIPVDGRLLAVTLKAPADGGVAVDLIDGNKTTVATIGEVQAGASATLDIFIAPVGPQPLHVGIRAIDSKRSTGFAERYTMAIAISKPGLERFSLPKQKP